MSTCHYTYCRAPLADGDTVCPVCSFPRDPTRLQDLSFLAGIAVDDKPERIVDMHQILPAIDGVLEMQLAAMQGFGVTRVLLQSAPPQATSLWGNEQLLGLAQKHGDRFWASQFVDPRMQGAIDALEHFAQNGVKVVKLLPVAGYRGDDPALDDFWDAMQRLELVAMIHTGFITARHKAEEAKAGLFMSSRYANPLHFDLTARKFPRLTFILCHLGGAIWHEAGAQMVTQHDNVWGDVSGFGLFALQRLLHARATLDWGKVFWGNDSPPFAYPFNLRLHLTALRRYDALELAPRLLHDNGQSFGEQFLG
ncbi:MAG: amidohydrolase family protein [Acidobacteriota bacterium]